MFLDLGFIKVPLLPQSVYVVQNSRVVVILSKISDDLVLAGPVNFTDSLTDRINEIFTLGTVTKGLGLLRYFGLKITQNYGFSISVDADDKLAAM